MTVTIKYLASWCLNLKYKGSRLAGRMNRASQSLIQKYLGIWMALFRRRGLWRASWVACRLRWTPQDKTKRRSRRMMTRKLTTSQSLNQKHLGIWMVVRKRKGLQVMSWVI